MCECMCDVGDVCVCVYDKCESVVVIHLPEETFPESVPSLHHGEAGLSCLRFHCAHSGWASLELPGTFLVSSSHLTIGGLGLQMHFIQLPVNPRSQTPVFRLAGKRSLSPSLFAVLSSSSCSSRL